VASLEGRELIDAIRREHRRTWWALIARGLLALGIGVLILSRPLDSLGVIALVIALGAILSGMMEIIHALETRSTFPSWWLLLAGGLVTTGFGVAAIYAYPELSLTFIAIWVGLLFATSGVVVIYSSIQMRHAGISWAWACVCGILSIAASGVAFINPPATVAAILALLAVVSIGCGMALLIAAWRIRGFTKRLAAALQSAQIS
jgi:uncharacterized membrane protein HdeD (DUF308 family)